MVVILRLLQRKGSTLYGQLTCTGRGGSGILRGYSRRVHLSGSVGHVRTTVGFHAAQVIMYTWKCHNSQGTLIYIYRIYIYIALRKYHKSVYIYLLKHVCHAIIRCKPGCIMECFYYEPPVT